MNTTSLATATARYAADRKAQTEVIAAGASGDAARYQRALAARDVTHKALMATFGR